MNLSNVKCHDGGVTTSRFPFLYFCSSHILDLMSQFLFPVWSQYPPLTRIFPLISPFREPWHRRQECEDTTTRKTQKNTKNEDTSKSQLAKHCCLLKFKGQTKTVFQSVHLIVLDTIYHLCRHFQNTHRLFIRNFIHDAANCSWVSQKGGLIFQFINTL